MFGSHRVHKVVNKTRINVLSSVFQRSISHMSKPFVFFFVRIYIPDRSQDIVMNMPVVEELRDVTRWKISPSLRWNLWKRNHITTLLQATILLDHFRRKPFSFVDTRIESVMLSSLYTFRNTFHKVVTFSA